MEDKIFVRELQNYLNKEIISYFLVTQKELRQDKNDNYFIRLKITDKTGSITGNVWNNAKPISEMFEEGDVIKIKAKVVSFNTQIQLSITKIRKMENEEFDLTNFLETTTKDIDELSDKLFSYIDNLENEYLKKLLLIIFEDKEFFNLFAKAPAAKNWHHNYIGGLLEHTVSVVQICDFASKMYPVNKDILITGAILHDIGKVFEYNVKTVIDFSVQGRLIGHIPLGDQFVCEKAAAVNNFPEDLLMKIRHLILSHHGEYEKASARLPQTIEAVVLHYADNLDAQTVGVKQLIEANQNPNAKWTEFDRLNERYYYLK
ncbi:MAG: 3'-5' exonuclease [Candidatus Cloacimonas sp. 4484_275]|nr:MAG: 3'-5' exonuclease [Candidatus Cloacimonas sp. 4484_275]